MKGQGYAAADIFCKLTGLRGFVDCDRSLILVSIVSVYTAEGNRLTATATETITMAPETTTG